MRRHLLHDGLLLVLLPLLLTLAGCGAMPGNTVGGTGAGADAGPWPTPPAHAAVDANSMSADQNPNTSVLVVLRASTAEDQELRLAITGVQLNSGGQWFDLAKAAEIKANYPQPIRVVSKGSAVLLAKNAKVPKRKYSQCRLLVDGTNSLLVTASAKMPLTLKNTAFMLKDLPDAKPDSTADSTAGQKSKDKEWTPDAKKAWNVLVITLDGSKVVPSQDNSGATLPAEAASISLEDANGTVTGKMVPILPTARVEAYWGGSKISLGSDTPTAQDGSFTIKNLPDGAYTLDYTTPGYRLVDPAQESVSVAKGKTATLKDVVLTPETTTQP